MRLWRAAGPAPGAPPSGLLDPLYKYYKRNTKHGETLLCSPAPGAGGRKVNAWQRTFNTRLPHGRLPLPLIDLSRGGGRSDRVCVNNVNVVGSDRV